MSNSAYKLFECINQEYHNRLDNGDFPGEPSVFQYQLFVEKYGYNRDLLESLLEELADNNFIEKWVIDAFKLIVD